MSTEEMQDLGETWRQQLGIDGSMGDGGWIACGHSDGAGGEQ